MSSTPSRHSKRNQPGFYMASRRVGPTPELVEYWDEIEADPMGQKLGFLFDRTTGQPTFHGRKVDWWPA
jgi:hypothetical protein